MGEERTPKNAPGPFYVAKDQCITCMAPEAEAPDLMAFDEEVTSCYFHRQPQSPNETYRAIRAMWVSCCGALRYGGRDAEVLTRLVNIGLVGQIDAPTDAKPGPGPCTAVLFAHSGGAAGAHGIAAEVGRQMIAAFGYGSATTPTGSDAEASFVWAWAPTIPGAALRLVVRAVVPGSRWVLLLADPHHPAAASIATSVDDALRAMRHVSDIKWYAGHDWATRPERWSSLPI